MWHVSLVRGCNGAWPLFKCSSVSDQLTKNRLCTAVARAPQARVFAIYHTGRSQGPFSGAGAFSASYSFHWVQVCASRALALVELSLSKKLHYCSQRSRGVPVRTYKQEPCKRTSQKLSTPFTRYDRIGPRRRHRKFVTGDVPCIARHLTPQTSPFAQSGSADTLLSDC